jgi:hypothetical protein
LVRLPWPDSIRDATNNLRTVVECGVWCPNTIARLDKSACLGVLTWLWGTPCRGVMQCTIAAAGDDRLSLHGLSERVAESTNAIARVERIAFDTDCIPDRGSSWWGPNTGTEHAQTLPEAMNHSVTYCWRVWCESKGRRVLSTSIEVYLGSVKSHCMYPCGNALGSVRAEHWVSWECENG